MCECECVREIECEREREIEREREGVCVCVCGQWLAGGLPLAVAGGKTPTQPATHRGGGHHRPGRDLSAT